MPNIFQKMLERLNKLAPNLPQNASTVVGMEEELSPSQTNLSLEEKPEQATEDPWRNKRGSQDQSVVETAIWSLNTVQMTILFKSMGKMWFCVNKNWFLTHSSITKPLLFLDLLYSSLNNLYVRQNFSSLFLNRKEKKGKRVLTY